MSPLLQPPTTFRAPFSERALLSLPPLLSSLPSPSTDLRETKNRKPDKERLEILAAVFLEKPVPGQGESAIIYSPWTKAELRI